MLFVVVIEFFICWTPMYVMNTWFLFDRDTAQKHVSPGAMNFIHLLAYASSITNPITYCFMNQKFRKGFLMAFSCCPCVKPYASEPTSFANSQRTGKSSPEKRTTTSFIFKLFKSKSQRDEVKMQKLLAGGGAVIDEDAGNNRQPDDV
jgi:cholecystokinin A receptor/cholecystokinin-like receptor